MSTDNRDRIENHVGLTQPDADEQNTTSDQTTGKHLFIDGGDGKEKEATLLSHHAGASSDAPANSGIPSAVKQHVLREQALPEQEETETPMPDRVLPTRQNVEP